MYVLRATHAGNCPRVRLTRRLVVALVRAHGAQYAHTTAAFLGQGQGALKSFATTQGAMGFREAPSVSEQPRNVIQIPR
jgi:hypothetical protein